MKNPTTTSPVEVQNSPQGRSHLNPIPVWVSAKTRIERGMGNAPESYDVEITIQEIVRGKEAWERIKAQDVSNEPPKAGFEYILARMKFGYFRRGRGFSDEAYKVTGGQFAAVSAEGKTEYEMPSVLQEPQPQLINGIFSPGESREGWILLQAPKDEKKPLLIFKREKVEGVYWVWGYVWFKLYL
jgi:hypothetical protein